jgi:hypothetical protein
VPQRPCRGQPCFIAPTFPWRRESSLSGAAGQKSQRRAVFGNSRPQAGLDRSTTRVSTACGRRRRRSRHQRPRSSTVWRHRRRRSGHLRPGSSTVWRHRRRRSGTYGRDPRPFGVIGGTVPGTTTPILDRLASSSAAFPTLTTAILDRLASTSTTFPAPNTGISAVGRHRRRHSRSQRPDLGPLGVVVDRIPGANDRISDRWASSSTAFPEPTTGSPTVGRYCRPRLVAHCMESIEPEPPSWRAAYSSRWGVPAAPKTRSIGIAAQRTVENTGVSMRRSFAGCSTPIPSCSNRRPAQHHPRADCPVPRYRRIYSKYRRSHSY